MLGLPPVTHVTRGAGLSGSWLVACDRGPAGWIQVPQGKSQACNPCLPCRRARGRGRLRPFRTRGAFNEILVQDSARARGCRRGNVVFRRGGIRRRLSGAVLRARLHRRCRAGVARAHVEHRQPVERGDQRIAGARGLHRGRRHAAPRLDLSASGGGQYGRQLHGGDSCVFRLEPGHRVQRRRVGARRGRNVHEFERRRRQVRVRQYRHSTFRRERPDAHARREAVLYAWSRVRFGSCGFVLRPGRGLHRQHRSGRDDSTAAADLGKSFLPAVRGREPADDVDDLPRPAQR